MTLVRTHYVIDMITGAIIAHYMYVGAEWISFFIDVKLMGFPREVRFFYIYTPCKTCGWSNVNAKDYMDKKEIKKM